MTDCDTIIEWRARLKRARKAAKRERDAEHESLSRRVRAMSASALLPTSPVGTVVRLLTVPLGPMAGVWAWGYSTPNLGHWDLPHPAIPQWRSRLDVRRSLPMVGQEWWRNRKQQKAWDRHLAWDGGPS